MLFQMPGDDVTCGGVKTQGGEKNRTVKIKKKKKVLKKINNNNPTVYCLLRDYLPKKQNKKIVYLFF